MVEIYCKRPKGAVARVPYACNSTRGLYEEAGNEGGGAGEWWKLRDCGRFNLSKSKQETRKLKKKKMREKRRGDEEKDMDTGL
jgi:hypothetical protein